MNQLKLILPYRYFKMALIKNNWKNKVFIASAYTITKSMCLIFLFCFVLFCFVLFCFVLFCFVLFCFVLFCFVLFCFVLFCFVLFCFVLFCFVLFCFVLFIAANHPSGPQLSIPARLYPLFTSIPLPIYCDAFVEVRYDHNNSVVVRGILLIIISSSFLLFSSCIYYIFYYSYLCYMTDKKISRTIPRRLFTLILNLTGEGMIFKIIFNLI